MSESTIKQRIYELIQQENDAGVSVGRIQQKEGCSGDWEFGKNNLVTAFGLSEEAAKALAELEDEKLIDIEPVDWFVPAYDGTGFPGYPLMTTKGAAKGYKTPHYFPVLFHTYPSPTRKKMLGKQTTGKGFGRK